MHSTRIDFDLTIPGLPDFLRDYNAKRIEKEHVETERGVVLLPVDHLFFFCQFFFVKVRFVIQKRLLTAVLRLEYCLILLNSNYDPHDCQ